MDSTNTTISTANSSNHEDFGAVTYNGGVVSQSSEFRVQGSNNGRVKITREYGSMSEQLVKDTSLR
jgi:hypothetical protein